MKEPRRFIVIFTDKETGEYRRYEAPFVNEMRTKEKLHELVDSWNKNEKNDTNAKIYDDPLLSEFCMDAVTSYKLQQCVRDLSDYANRIDDMINDLHCEIENLQDFLKENYPKELEHDS